MASKRQQSKGFVPSTKKQQLEALGDIDQLSEELRRAVTVGIDESFLPIPQPGADDWLSSQHEEGQTVKQFERLKKIQPTATCNLIVIQPLGDFDGPRSPSLDIICEFSRLFFPGCQTEVHPPVDFERNIKQRINSYTQQPQYFVDGLIAQLKRLQRKRRNRQELLCIGVTMVDIYPDPKWNFVYGQASIDEGIAIYSFARLDPRFPHSSVESAQTPCTDAERILMLKRAVSTYVHEAIHLFGVEHCIYYSCLMNGANCEEEMDGQAMYLCPVCLRKMSLLFHKHDFHVIRMYEGLFELSNRVGFDEDATWYADRLRRIRSERLE